MDEEEADALEEAFDHDYGMYNFLCNFDVIYLTVNVSCEDVAQSFRSHIIPNAVAWFTGEVSRMLNNLLFSATMFAKMLFVQALDEQFDIDTDVNLNIAQDTNAESNSPFPPPINGEENPECKQN